MIVKADYQGWGPNNIYFLHWHALQPTVSIYRVPGFSKVIDSILVYKYVSGRENTQAITAVVRIVQLAPTTYLSRTSLSET